MENTALVGLVGKAEAGKTTIANYLVQNYNFKLFSFAEPLKRMLLEAEMCPREELYGKKTDNSRWLMQKIGTDIFRKQVDKDYWVKRCGEVVNLLLRLGDVVIDDVRFPNEAEYITQKGGMLIRVIREDHKGLKGNSGKHKSETLLDEIRTDYVVSAKSGELGKLFADVTKIVRVEYLLQSDSIGGFNAS